MEKALGHIRVLDITEGIAGPFCTKLLAGCGADVIKIEPIGKGDISRSFPPFWKGIPHHENSGLFIHLNTGKRSMTLNLETVAGKHIFQELVRLTDVITESSQTGAMQKLGLSYQELTKENPNLILASFSPYGQTGPWSTYQATELTLQATSGVMSFTGTPDREPLKSYGYQSQYMAGVQGALASLAAMYLLQETGQGQHVDMAIQESAAMFLAGGEVWYSYFGALDQRDGGRVAHSRTRQGYSGNVLPCKDGHVYFGAGHNQDMIALLVGEPWLDSEELWKKPGPYADQIDDAIRPWLSEHSRDEVTQLGQELRIAIAPVMNLEEVTEDPQHHSRGFFQHIDNIHAEGITVPGAPFKMSETPWEVCRAPRLGEHTNEILGDLLGYRSSDLITLRNSESI